jgi:hypothetical protein
MRPYQLIQKSVNLEGEVFYILPPNPAGHPYEMLVATDWIRYPEKWETASHGAIPNLVPDGHALVERNFRANRRLGFKHDWKELWGRETGKTCLLVSCGPSLPESVEEIRKLRGKPGHFTLGINRALRATACDYFVAMDRRAASDASGITDWIDEDPRNTTLIASTSVCSDIPPRFRNRYWGEHFVTAQHTRCAPLGAAMVITLCDAMHAAYKLGATEIKLYGCDFSLPGVKGGTKDKPRWDIGNYYHDMGAAGPLNIRIQPFRKLLPVEGRGNTMAFVNWEQVCNAAYTTCMAMMLEGGGVRVVNRTPRGILWETWHEHDICNPLCVCAEASS